MSDSRAFKDSRVSLRAACFGPRIETGPTRKYLFDDFHDYRYNAGKQKRRNTMSKLYLIDIPDELHLQVKTRAAMMGVSVKELMVQVLTEFLEKTSEQDR